MAAPQNQGEIVRLHAFVRGRVQGVGFRNFVVNQAARLGLSGWVRNRINGSVEVMAQGKRPAVEALLHDLHRGPAMAYVTKVETEWLPPDPELKSFRIRFTM